MCVHLSPPLVALPPVHFMQVHPDVYSCVVEGCPLETKECLSTMTSPVHVDVHEDPRMGRRSTPSVGRQTVFHVVVVVVGVVRLQNGQLIENATVINSIMNL